MDFASLMAYVVGLCAMIPIVLWSLLFIVGVVEDAHMAEIRRRNSRRVESTGRAYRAALWREDGS